MIALFWIIIAFFYIKLAFWLARFLSRHSQKTKTQKLVKFGVALVFVLIPTWDVILGRLYFNHLCATEGGIKIYRQAELSDKYWDEKNNPVFIVGGGKFDPTPLKNQYKFINIHKEPDSIAKFLNIKQTAKSIVKTESDEILGQYILFYYFGGWLFNSTGLHVSADVCPPIRAGVTRSFINQVFIPNNQGS